MPRKYLAVIPARRGSKGIVGKNMQIIGAKPMVQYAMDVAREVFPEDQVIVTSDDPRVLQLAHDLAAGFPLARPQHLAGDSIAQADVVHHALDWYEREVGRTPENIVLLQPTSPFRTVEDLRGALARFEASGRSSLISISAVSQHPYNCVRLDEKRSTLESFRPAKARGRQDYDDFYLVNGAIYVASTAWFRRTSLFHDRESAVFEMSPSHSLDVDAPLDLLVARALLHYRATVDDPLVVD